MKDFKNWHTLKEKIEKYNRRLYFHEREILFCSLGANVGYEEDGKGEGFIRPVLILRKFDRNTFFAFPLTSKVKSSKYHFQFTFKGKPSTAILSQLRLIDSKRLRRRFGKISHEDFLKLIHDTAGLIIKGDPPASKGRGSPGTHKDDQDVSSIAKSK